MKASEKETMMNLYKSQFTYFLQSNESDFERLQLNGMKAMIKLFFTDKEINAIENNIRVTNTYRKDLFEVVESWLRQIEKEKGVKEYLFTWNEAGLNKVKRNYDWLFEDYKGLQLAIDNTLNTIQRAA